LRARADDFRGRDFVGAATMLITELLAGYRSGRISPLQSVESVLEAIARAPERNAWITLLPRGRVLAMAQALVSRSPDSLALYGVPFAIKDNIDLAGIPTTAGCPGYAYTPSESAFVVQRLIDAGAIPVGKTNLDQFATGLVGTRSPHGACHNSFDPAYISGGSSSGSAVAVATGLVSFALGTDTAGSGRVPAAFNNLIGLKPTRGALSCRGVVPACRSLDSVSIFALTADDAQRVYAVASGFDPQDAYSTPLAGPRRGTPDIGFEGLRVGVPRPSQLSFFDDTDYSRLFAETVGQLEALGATPVEIDFEPFLAVARLLYAGPWVAERYCAVGDFLEQHPEAVYPVTRDIISGGRNPTAADAFRAQYRLMELRRATQEAWSRVDVLVTPTAGTIYRIAAVNADPVRLNSNLGYYTNFVNLLDLAAVAVPAGFRTDGIPFGVSIVGRAGSDYELLGLAMRLQRARVKRVGALDAPVPALDQSGAPDASADDIPVAVCGAHMLGLPLNHQLTNRGARFLCRTRTNPVYALYALPGGPPHRPGLIRVAHGGAAIEVEVWSVPATEFGSFVNGIPAPLSIGKVELQDGSRVSGFVCEAHAAAGARDITSLGGWRRYLETVRMPE
jgi:allophanate hydrolase